MALPEPVTKTGSTYLQSNFSDLINERAMDLAELKMQLHEKGLLGDRDNITLVRYLCSFGTVEHTFRAVEAAERILREKDFVIKAAESGQPLPTAPRIEPFQKVTAWQVSENEMLYIIRVAHVDCKELLKHASVDEIKDYGLYLCRSMWQWVDSTSRRLGCICKYEVIVDFTGYAFTSWDKIPPPAYRKAMSQMSQFSEVIHPLSQGCSVVIGLPGSSVAQRLLGLVKPLLPKSISETQLLDKEKLLQKYGTENLPIFLGGSRPASGAASETLEATSSLSLEEVEQFAAVLEKGIDADEMVRNAQSESN
mmetsp:Transcript_1153/g.2335  ORF Transcript_1153/g.2335 Transcript_1153/m.2335 type:complete len:309 (-) Transcript_1153:27-953(-)